MLRTPVAAEATEVPAKNRKRQDGRARSESTQTKRMDGQRPEEKVNPCHCAVCRALFEPGIPGGDPANALGFPSTTADGPAHRVLGGTPFLRVEAQKKLPHHAHGRGSQISK